MIDTSESLLGRLKVEDAHDAWKEFYRRYWQPILRYARKMDLREHEARDVLQDTMVALMRILPEFAYDRSRGRFRNFLLTIVHRKALAVLRRGRAPGWVSLDAEGEFASNARLIDESVAVLDAGEEEAAVARWRESLLESALAHLRTSQTVDERTMQVFEAYVVARRPVAEVACEFGMRENAVYQIKNRILRRLRSTVEGMGSAADV